MISINLKEKHGGIKSMKCISVSAEFHHEPQLPWHISALFEVECDDGTTAFLYPTFMWTLCNGQVWANIDVDGETRSVYIEDAPIVAYIAQKQSNLERCALGNVELPSESEAERLMEYLGVPPEPVEVPQQKKFDWWMKYWADKGMLCQMDDGQWVIEDYLGDWAKPHIVKHAAVKGVAAGYEPPNFDPMPDLPPVEEVLKQYPPDEPPGKTDGESL